MGRSDGCVGRPASIRAELVAASRERGESLGLGGCISGAGAVITAAAEKSRGLLPLVLVTTRIGKTSSVVERVSLPGEVRGADADGAAERQTHNLNVPPDHARDKIRHALGHHVDEGDEVENTGDQCHEPIIRSEHYIYPVFYGITPQPYQNQKIETSPNVHHGEPQDHKTELRGENANEPGAQLQNCGGRFTVPGHRHRHRNDHFGIVFCFFAVASALI